MRRVVIHAGLPKAGSTFLQEKVFSKIPKEVCAFNPNGIHDLLVDLCKKTIARGQLTDAEFAELEFRIHQEMDTVEAPVLLISVEGLMSVHCCGLGVAEAIMKNIERLFRDATILLVFREQLAWIKSCYSLFLSNGLAMTFDEYINHRKNGEFEAAVPGYLGISVFDYDFSRMEGIVRQGFNRVLCFRFEDIFSEQQADSLGCLLREVGAPYQPVDIEEEVNKGLDERMMVIASRILSKIPCRRRISLRYMYPGLVGLSFRERLMRSYLIFCGRLTLAVSRLIFNYTSCAIDARLVASADESLMRSKYFMSNDEYWKSSGGLR